MARFRVRSRGNFTVLALIKLVSVLVLTLYAGGIFFDAIGDAMVGTCSAFYPSILTTFGFTGNFSSGGTCIATNTGSATLLALVGLVGAIGIIMRFVKVQWN